MICFVVAIVSWQLVQLAFSPKLKHLPLVEENF